MASTATDLAGRQNESLRRVAALVAGGADSAEVLAGVAREVATVTGSALVQIQRFDRDDSVVVAGAWGERPHPFQPGTRWSLEGSQIAAAIKRTGRPVRVDQFAPTGGELQDGVKQTGIRGGAGAPILVAGEVWGCMAAGPAPGEPLPPGLEKTLAEFTALVATAISNTESRAAVERLADEQAALRRVATLVAKGTPTEDLFRAVTREAGALLHADMAEMIHYLTDHSHEAIAIWSAHGDQPEVGREWSMDGDPGSPVERIYRTGRAARKDDWSDDTGPIATFNREQLGIRSSVGSPVVVEGSVWGAVLVHSTTDETLPPTTEERLANFTELVATAISNSEARDEVRRLADEQAALRRVATLVAGGARPAEVFDVVANELGRLIGLSEMLMVRYDDDAACTMVAAGGQLLEVIGVGTRVPLGGNNIFTLVHERGKPVRIDDHSQATGAAAVFPHEVTRAAVGCPIVVGGRLWGAVAVASMTPDPIPPDTEARMTEFTELVATAIANSEARAEVERLAREQATLRRVATMVAQAADPETLFGKLVEEIGDLLGVDAVGLARFPTPQVMEPLATWMKGGEHPSLPERIEIKPESLSAATIRTGKPSRIDDWKPFDSVISTVVRQQMGMHSSVAAPITVEGEVWGAIAVHTREGPLPADTEARLERFTALVVTAITNAQARAEVRRLADEQAALRRVATLVAHEATPEEVFGAVAHELAGLLGTDDTGMVRYEGDGTALVVARAMNLLPENDLLGRRLPLKGRNVVTLVHETGRTGRIDDHGASSGEVGKYAKDAGARSTVGCPIHLGGRLWGAMLVSSGAGPLPPETEERMAEFTELVETAIANIEARRDLAASRARIVAAADDERRRVVRDLHDGAQQRLVHTVVTLKLAGRALEEGADNAPELLDDALEQAESATHELRELVQGIMPSVLTRGGLLGGVESLASRMPVPVGIDVPGDRVDPGLEAAAYFVVAEALTNVAKHANARQAAVSARIADGALRIEVRDDGVGGARAEGSGLTGMRDRVAVYEGQLTVDSPPGGGTVVTAVIPIVATGDGGGGT